MLFFRGLGGEHAVLFVTVFLASFATMELLNLVQVWFLGFWASQYEKHEDDPSQVNVVQYVAAVSYVRYNV